MQPLLLSTVILTCSQPRVNGSLPISWPSLDSHDALCSSRVLLSWSRNIKSFCPLRAWRSSQKLQCRRAILQQKAIKNIPCHNHAIRRETGSGMHLLGRAQHPTSNRVTLPTLLLGTLHILEGLSNRLLSPVEFPAQSRPLSTLKSHLVDPRPRKSLDSLPLRTRQ